jgi:hypothetical protein
MPHIDLFHASLITTLVSAHNTAVLPALATTFLSTNDATLFPTLDAIVYFATIEYSQECASERAVVMSTINMPEVAEDILG